MEDYDDQDNVQITETCDICGKLFSNRRSLKDKVFLHEIKSFPYDFCQYRFKRKTNLLKLV